MHGHQKGVAEEGLEEQQKLIMQKLHVISHKWAHKKITMQTWWYNDLKILQAICQVWPFSPEKTNADSDAVYGGRRL